MCKDNLRYWIILYEEAAEDKNRKDPNWYKYEAEKMKQLLKKLEEERPCIGIL